MNKTEHKMVEILTRGREKFGIVSVKAEFEAEGTRIEELLRLVDVARASGLPMTVKIGGCEAIRDLLEAKQIGVRYIVAPMVETPYALSKYAAATNLIYTEEEREDTDFLFNLETITGFDNLAGMVEEASKPNSVNGMVFGRVDFSGSLGVGRSGIETDEVSN
jgi:citrate lyase beta subunit